MAISKTGLPPLTLRSPSERPFDGVVLTGSHAMVTDREPWSEQTAAWLRDAVYVSLPVLGICYGHQLLAHALGGTVDNHPGGLESGTTVIWRQPEADRDPLFAELPSHWHAQVSHRQTVTQLPHGAVLLAYNRFEPHHAFRFGDCAWGVQFHPEFMPEATRAYLLHQTTPLTEQGQDPQRMQTEVQPTPEARSLLGRFATWVATHRKALVRTAPTADDLARYAGSDLVCYRAGEPERLAGALDHLHRRRVAVPGGHHDLLGPRDGTPTTLVVAGDQRGPGRELLQHGVEDVAAVGARRGRRPARPR